MRKGLQISAAEGEFLLKQKYRRMPDNMLTQQVRNLRARANQTQELSIAEAEATRRQIDLSLLTSQTAKSS